MIRICTIYSHLQHPSVSSEGALFVSCTSCTAPTQHQISPADPATSQTLGQDLKLSIYNLLAEVTSCIPGSIRMNIVGAAPS